MIQKNARTDPKFFNLNPCLCSRKLSLDIIILVIEIQPLGAALKSEHDSTIDRILGGSKTE